MIFETARRFRLRLPARYAKLAAVEILLADPESLQDDVLESCLYELRERLYDTPTHRSPRFSRHGPLPIEGSRMGVDVILMRVTQHGSSRRSRRLSPLEVVPDDGDILAQAFARSGTPVQSRAVPYQDPILTSAEMEQFIACPSPRFNTAVLSVLLTQFPFHS